MHTDLAVDLGGELLKAWAAKAEHGCAQYALDSAGGKMFEMIKAMNVRFWILCLSQCLHCCHTFLGLSSAANLSFMDVCRRSTIQLLIFANAAAVGSSISDRLFKAFDIHE